jgi:hypothetical protein
MTRLRTNGLLVILVAVTVAACSLIAPAVGLRTAPQPPMACMDALATGTLVKHPQSGLGISSGKESMPMEWPFGYTAHNEVGRLALVDEAGRVVAHEGDEIMVGGGFGTDVWHACGPVSIVVSD